MYFCFRKVGISTDPFCHCEEAVGRRGNPVENMKVRTANITDISSIMKIESAGFIPQIQEEQHVFEQRIKACPELFLVFEDETSGKVAGYLSAEYLDKLPSCAAELALGHVPNKSSSSSIIYISSFSILPEYRGNGTGKLLWNQAMEYFESLHTAPSLLLLVNQAWPGAKHIYENSGFKVINTFHEFFPTETSQRTDGILMIK